MKNFGISLASSFSRGCITLTAVVLIAALWQSSTAQGQGGDFVDGAIWGFTMVPKSGEKRALKGQYRIHNTIVFQKEKRTDQKFSKRVGKNFPKKGKTRLEFTDFRAMDRDRVWHDGMKGTAWLSMNKIGKWSGLLTDSKGKNWDFTCNRIKE